MDVVKDSVMLGRKFLAAMLAVVCVTYVNSSHAADPGEGEYVREGDSGILVIKKSDNGKLLFQLDSYGANGHSCSVGGTIKEGVGSDSEEGGCQIAFKYLTPAKVDVQPLTSEECLGFCGMRAHLDGEYVIPPANCTHKGVQAQRSQFLKLYRGRDYKRAADKAKSIIAACEPFIDWITIDEIRNDLAVAQFHKGDLDACNQTLTATRSSGYSSVQEVRDDLPPTDADSYERVAKATFYNRTLCSKSREHK